MNRIRGWKAGSEGKLLELSTEPGIRKDLTVYDVCCVALAKRTNARVVTGDKELPARFPAEALALSDFKASHKG